MLKDVFIETFYVNVHFVKDDILYRVCTARILTYFKQNKARRVVFPAVRRTLFPCSFLSHADHDEKTLNFKQSCATKREGGWGGGGGNSS